MWGAYFTEGPVRNYGRCKAATDTALFRARWHKAARSLGGFSSWPPSAFEAGFVLGGRNTEADIDFTIEQLDAALAEARGR